MELNLSSGEATQPASTIGILFIQQATVVVTRIRALSNQRVIKKGNGSLLISAQSAVPGKGNSDWNQLRICMLSTSRRFSVRFEGYFGRMVLSG